MKKFPIKKLKGLNDQEKLKFIREWFKNNFIFDQTNNKKIIVKTHDGKRVIFKDLKYNHAFTKKDNITGKRKIDYARLRYIHLIEDTLKLNNNPYFKDGLDKIHKEYRRWYFDTNKNYLVILTRLKRGNFHFVSAYFVQSNKERLKMLKFIVSP